MKRDFDPRSLMELAGDADLSSMCLHDIMRDGHPQSRTFMLLARMGSAVVAVKNPVQFLFADAFPMILYDHRHRIRRFLYPNLNERIFCVVNHRVVDQIADGPANEEV